VRLRGRREGRRQQIGMQKGKKGEKEKRILSNYYRVREVNQEGGSW